MQCVLSIFVSMFLYDVYLYFPPKVNNIINNGFMAPNLILSIQYWNKDVYGIITQELSRDYKICIP